ncbi:MAG: DUF2493 domain-containing protein [Candidatus Woesearchaeota archaeon]
MKLGIVGSRNFNNFKLLENTILGNFSNLEYIDVIVSGGAKGADTLAEKFAEKYNIKTEIYKPDWKTHGKKAGFIRNREIVDNSDFVIAFWNGESKGTLSTINLVRKHKGEDKILIIYFKGDI